MNVFVNANKHQQEIRGSRRDLAPDGSRSFRFSHTLFSL